MIENQPTDKTSGQKFFTKFKEDVSRWLSGPDKPVSVSSRRGFLQKAAGAAVVAALAPETLLGATTEVKSSPTYTELIDSGKTFKNGEHLWRVRSREHGEVGSFIPIKMLDFLTRQTDPGVFADIENNPDLAKTLDGFNGYTMSPDGMTKFNGGRYKLEGKSLSHGRECGDDTIPNTGIVIFDGKGGNIRFTHKNEFTNNGVFDKSLFDATYEDVKNNGGSLLFLPSIFRNGKFLQSSNTVEKVLIRRTSPDGDQIGIVTFDTAVTYDKAREVLQGLDRPINRNNPNGPKKSETTHIYFLDGGPTWGGYAIKTEQNGSEAFGTVDPTKLTNFLVGF